MWLGGQEGDAACYATKALADTARSALLLRGANAHLKYCSNTAQILLKLPISLPILM